MVNALVQLSEKTNRVLNMVKATYGLKDKSQAIELVVAKFAEEDNLRPEFIKKMKEVMKQKSVPVDDFEKRYGLK